tara:strand:+ start:14968 stop:15258 length:291 start_codon:yes stop_codon:yes gene_type:complete
MKNFLFTSVIACFLFSTIFIAAGCAKKASVAPSPPPPVVEKKVEEKKVSIAPTPSPPPVIRLQVEDIELEVKPAVSEFTYEEIPAFRFFFLREQAR